MRSPGEQEDFLNHGRFDENRGVSLPRRFLFAVIGLLAGDTALLIMLLPALATTRDKSVLILYAVFSVVGWAMIGQPVALGTSPAFLRRLSWPARVVIGVALGPLSILVILIMLAAWQGNIKTFSLAYTGIYLEMSASVSAPSFVVYTALLRRHGGSAVR